MRTLALWGGLGVALCGVLAARAALAQDADRPSEADMFGAPASEAAPASADAPTAPGAPTSAAAPASEAGAAAPADPREAEMFGAPASEPGAAPADSREAEMFGTSASETAPASVPSGPRTGAPADRETALFGGGAQEVRRDPRVDEDKLALGGRLLLRAQMQAYTEVDAADQPLASPNLLDVYLDARPTDRLRAFAEFRVGYDPTLENGRAAIPDFCPEDPPDDDPDNAQCRAASDALARGLATPTTSHGINQLWIKFDVDRSVFLTLGRQPIRWGAGHIWNPTDFINKSKRDPLTTLDLRTGVTLVKVHVPLESSASNLYAIALIDEARQVGDVGGAARAEIAFEQAEISLSAAARRDRPLFAGGDFSFGLGPFDFFGEAAVAYGHHEPLPGDPDRDGDVIPQVAGGFSLQIDYGDEDSAIVGLEYFHNDDGLDDPADYGRALAAGRSYFDLPRNAAGLFALVAAPGRFDDTSFFVTAIGSLDDQSLTARLQWTQRVLTWLDVVTYVGGYAGDRGDLFRPAGYDPATGAPTDAALTAEAGTWLSVAL